MSLDSVYCGVDKLKKDQRYGTAEECIEKKQVRRYGRISIPEEQLNQRVRTAKASDAPNKQLLEMRISIAKMRGLIARYKRACEFVKQTDQERAVACETLRDHKEKLKVLEQQYLKVQKLVVQQDAEKEARQKAKEEKANKPKKAKGRPRVRPIIAEEDKRPKGRPRVRPIVKQEDKRSRGRPKTIPTTVRTEPERINDLATNMDKELKKDSKKYKKISTRKKSRKKENPPPSLMPTPQVIQNFEPNNKIDTDVDVKLARHEEKKKEKLSFVDESGIDSNDIRYVDAGNFNMFNDVAADAEDKEFYNRSMAKKKTVKTKKQKGAKLRHKVIPGYYGVTPFKPADQKLNDPNLLYNYGKNYELYNKDDYKVSIFTFNQARMEREDKMLIMKKLYTRKQLELIHKWTARYNDMDMDYNIASFLIANILKEF